MGEELEVSEGQKGPSQWEKDEEPEAEERAQDVICVPVKRAGHSFHSLTLGEGTRRRLERCELSRERALHARVWAEAVTECDGRVWVTPSRASLRTRGWGFPQQRGETQPRRLRQSVTSGKALLIS